MIHSIAETIVETGNLALSDQDASATPPLLPQQSKARREPRPPNCLPAAIPRNKKPREAFCSAGSGSISVSRTRLVVIHRAAIFEVQEPPPVVPFQRHFPPAQGHLRVGIERADVRPGSG